MTDNEKKPMKFWVKVCIHIALMIVAAVFLFWVMTYCLDFWTHHGQSIQVPSVKGMSYIEACAKLEDEGFEVVLNDSVYEESAFPGMVVEQNPKVDTKVKPGRTVYLTINAFYPRTVALPNLTDISVRQARATLEGLGINDIEIVKVPSDYADLVMSAKADGQRIVPGMRVRLTSKIMLEVGEGYVEPEILPDSLEVKLSAEPDEPTFETDTPDDLFD